LWLKKWFETALATWKEEEACRSFLEGTLQIEDFTLDGVKGVKGVKIKFLPELKTGGGCESFYLPKKGKVYVIRFCYYQPWFYSTPKFEATVKNIKEMILSTFMVIE